MQTLLDILLKIRFVLLFLLLEAISLVLLFKFNTMQNSVMTTAANGVSGWMLKTESGVTGFFYQGRENRLLAEENARLQSELFRLKDSLYMASLPQSGGDVVVARVIDNSISHDNNFITIDRGSDAGIDEGMGVYSPSGVVGVVYKSSRHYSLVLPLLNSKSSVSCRIRRLDSFGFLEWDGGDPAYAWLKDLPYHSGAQLGDTIVTSGFSQIFPKDIPVGVVSDVQTDATGVAPVVQVRLTVNFNRLGFVYVNTDTAPDELIQLNRMKK
ncbi:MAG: rod shape-determining protein MreC [Bacteroidaceae bacterium]|nr:rod shape-determining protein MreC [Bacteroidaceae bacterium]